MPSTPSFIPALQPHKKRVLVHICCGPCSIYPLKQVLEGAFEVWGFFHNPNIHPLSEFNRRLEAVRALAGHMKLDVIYDTEYRPTEFIKGIREHTGISEGHPGEEGGERCEYCYSSRMKETARVASERGFDAFTTSLLYSRHADHEGIRALGEELAVEHDIEFIYRDFREGWQEGIDESKALGLYRQNYCGCIYSRIERFKWKKSRKAKIAG